MGSDGSSPEARACRLGVRLQSGFVLTLALSRQGEEKSLTGPSRSIRPMLGYYRGGNNLGARHLPRGRLASGQRPGSVPPVLISSSTTPWAPASAE